MAENGKDKNKDELGAAYLQEMYEVGGGPDEVCIKVDNHSMLCYCFCHCCRYFVLSVS